MNLTTPAQIFHLLRRQVVRRLRKPLIVMTPKSLLRLPAARSELDELVHGGFQRILLQRDDGEVKPEAVRRILFCTGKICYDLLDERKKRGDASIAIVRVEQLYPLRDEELRAAIEHYPAATEIVWVQDEPANMGALNFILPRLWRLRQGRKVFASSRPESGSPATGSHRAHQIEQRRLLDEAFGVLGEEFGL